MQIVQGCNSTAAQLGRPSVHLPADTIEQYVCSENPWSSKAAWSVQVDQVS